jgi:hypothetical protein
MHLSRAPRRLLRGGISLALLCAAWAGPLQACTIFVLVDANRMLFCNNEDWFEPRVRIWFVPASGAKHGCAYVGFNDGWGQGGVNTAGLAYDWVGGFKIKWERRDQKSVQGNPSERMLETCATVDEAWAFFQRYWEPSFSTSKILVADRSGTSAVIQSRDGELRIVRAHDCRGFGANGRLVTKMLETTREPTLDTAATILRAAAQAGDGGTKYSNVYDLKTGDIYLFHPPTRPQPVKLNLVKELARGEHIYELARLPGQVTEPVRPLPWKPWWALWR